MTRVVLDAELRSKLLNLTEPVEVCDESGQVLGRYFPMLDLSRYERWEPEFSEEDLQRQEQAQEKRYSTAEVLAHLTPEPPAPAPR